MGVWWLGEGRRKLWGLWEEVVGIGEEGGPESWPKFSRLEESLLLIFPVVPFYFPNRTLTNTSAANICTTGSCALRSILHDYHKSEGSIGMPREPIWSLRKTGSTLHSKVGKQGMISATCPLQIKWYFLEKGRKYFQLSKAPERPASRSVHGIQVEWVSLHSISKQSMVLLRLSWNTR